MIHLGKSRLHRDKPFHSGYIFSDGAPRTDIASLVNPIQFAQEVGPKFTTKARFGFQILLNYTGGALIFIRREQLCWKLKQDALVPRFKNTFMDFWWKLDTCFLPQVCQPDPNHSKQRSGRKTK